jgi:GGDEF domain-containing protein
MPWDRLDRRRTGAQGMPVPEGYQLPERNGRPAADAGQIRLFDADTGFYTMPALYEFIQYEIDGSAQTLRNELYITPLCIAAIDITPPHGVKDDLQRSRFLAAASDAIRNTLRVADRVAREGDVFVALVRRTLAASVRDKFTPRLTARLTAACADWGKITVSVGVSSLVEHAARNPEHMVRMALRALNEAHKQSGGGAVIYDFRAMPLG